MSDVEPVNNYGLYDRRGPRPAGADRRKGAAKPVGRYDGRSHKTRLPPAGLVDMPKSRNRETAIAAIQDPLGDGDERVILKVNARVDLLEQERSRNRISEAAYRVGRQIQAVFERGTLMSGSNWVGTSRVDPARAIDRRMASHLDHSREILALIDRMRARIGMIDTRLLRRLLGENISLAQCACLEGKGGPRGEAYLWGRFRDALEDLAEAWTAKGKATASPDDMHAIAGATAAERQRLALMVAAEEARRALEGADRDWDALEAAKGDGAV